MEPCVAYEIHLPLCTLTISGWFCCALDSIFGGKEQISAVHIASQCRDEDVAVLEALVEKGANVQSLDCYGRTPLHFACQTDSVAATAVLCDMASRDICQCTVLHTAQCCRLHSVRFLTQSSVHFFSGPTAGAGSTRFSRLQRKLPSPHRGYNRVCALCPGKHEALRFIALQHNSCGDCTERAERISD